VLACSSLVFLANCREEGLFRWGEEDERGEVDLRPLSCSSIEGANDVELLVLGLAVELAAL